MKGLKIFLAVAGVFLLWLVFALVTTAAKTMAQRKNRPPVAQTQQQEPPPASGIERPRIRQ